MCTIKKIVWKPSKRPKYLDDGYDCEEGLLDEEKEQLHNAMLELWPIGEVPPE
jgi:hypothetical protein